jgi:hypothetical protein
MLALKMAIGDIRLKSRWPPYNFRRSENSWPGKRQSSHPQWLIAAEISEENGGCIIFLKLLLENIKISC